MLEVWQESTSFQPTSQRLADQVRTIIKEVWSSDLEIQEIRQKTNNEQDTNTISDTLCFHKQVQSNRNEPPNLENRNTIQPHNKEQTLIQEQKIDFENLKRIMNEQRTTLPPRRNIEWRTIKMETEKINQVLTNLSIKNKTEVNELIYAGAKLVCEKIEVHLIARIKSKNPDGKFDCKR